MEFRSFDDLKNIAFKKEIKTIVVAAAHDIYTLKALFEAMDEMPLEYVLVGNATKIYEIAKNLGKEVLEERVFNSKSDDETAFKAVELVREGIGDVLMKGSIKTGTLLNAIVSSETGIGKGGVSYLSVIESPNYHKLLFVTDGGMCPHPDLAQKVQITKNAIDFLHKLGYEEPYVAALSAVETVNDKMQETIDAEELENMSKNGDFGKCILEGPLSIDIAINKESALVKEVESEVSGNVDLLICDCITTGNIFTNGLVYLGNAKIAGCIVGASVPIVLVSRGASDDEKKLSIMLSLAVN
ncbi:MAG: phosphate acyltransferase [Oscillospiraceae bacterium]|nr:phosphate acyltransferase [Oscillospiraceae bacterium]